MKVKAVLVDDVEVVNLYGMDFEVEGKDELKAFGQVFEIVHTKKATKKKKSEDKKVAKVEFDEFIETDVEK